MFDVDSMVINLDGKEYPILKYLDREEKQALAYDIVTRACIMDEDTGLVLLNPYDDVETMMLLIEAYTDIEVPEEHEARVKLFDKLIQEGVYIPDSRDVLDIAAIMKYNFFRVQDHKSSLQYPIKKMLPELMDDESVSETIAKGSGITEFLIRLMGIAIEGDDKKNKGKLNVSKRNKS